MKKIRVDKQILWISFLMSACLWLIFNFQNKITIEKNFSLEYSLKADDQVEEAPVSVRVRLKGPRQVLRRYLQQNQNLLVDLRKMDSGLNLILLKEESLGLPVGVDVESMSPPQIRLYLKKKIPSK